MKVRIKNSLLFIVVLLAPVCFFLVFYTGLHSSRIRLLYRTDHQELLNAGREILSKANVEYEIINGIRTDRFHDLPKDVEVPKVIRRLTLIGLPGIHIHNYGYIRIVVGKNRDNLFGVHIYPEDFKEPYVNYGYGNKELMSGLWYFDIGYVEDPEYDKVIDSIIKNGKFPRAK